MEVLVKVPVEALAEDQRPKSDGVHDLPTLNPLSRNIQILYLPS